MMFDRFQGGTHVELFDAKTSPRLRTRTSAVASSRARETTTGDDSCRSTSSALPAWYGCGARVYDRAARGYAVCVRGEVRSCANIRATQPILVFQCHASASARFAFEVRVADTADARRRLVFSSSFTEVKTSPLHCQVPLRDLPRDEWVNVLLPLAELVPACFGSASVAFKAVESIAIRGTCKIRKIFTLRGDTQTQAWTSDGYSGSASEHAIVIPRECDFPCGVRAAAHTVIPNHEYDAEYASDSERMHANKAEKTFNVAFGRRIPVTQSNARDRHAMAPTTYDEDGYANDQSRRRRVDVARWSNLDQIMSNLRIRDNRNGRQSRSSNATSATSSSSSCKSSYFARSSERAASLDMRDITLGAVPCDGERSLRYAYDNDDELDDEDDDIDDSDDEFHDDDAENDVDDDNDDADDDAEDDVDCGLLYDPTNGVFYDDDNPYDDNHEDTDDENAAIHITRSV